MLTPLRSQETTQEEGSSSLNNSSWKEQQLNQVLLDDTIIPGLDRYPSPGHDEEISPYRGSGSIIHMPGLHQSDVLSTPPPRANMEEEALKEDAAEADSPGLARTTAG